MQYSPKVGASRRKNVPVELIVIGAAVALGALFANGRAPATQKDVPPDVAGGRSVEVAYPAEEETAEATEAAPTPEPRAAAAVKRVATVPMPAGIPSDMPVLKDAALVSASADDGAGEYVLTWAVSASTPSDAARAYAALLAGKGWAVTSTADNPGSTVLVFERAEEKGGGGGWVAFIGDAPDMSATLTLSLAR